MSVMTRNPRTGQLEVGSQTGRPMGPLVEQAEPQRPELQRQAVIDQLGTTPAAQPAAQPVAGNMGAFARGGEVKQLPGMDKGKLVGSGLSTGANVAGKVLGTTAAGAAAGSGISMGTDYLAGKLKPKEEMPTFGGEFGHLTDQYGRRFEGAGPGVAGGAVKGAGYGANPGLVAATGGLSVAAGALGGAIWGAATKNAPSAFTDFRSEDAAEAIGKAYQEFYGRPATEAEIMEVMTGQGWDPNDGDRWMGEKPLNYVLGQIKGNAATEQQQRAALLAQMGTGGGEPVATNDVEPRTTGASGAQETGAARTGGDPGAWNTDGFASPQVTAQGFREQAPPGWDQTKWNDPNHQTPKYVWGRLSQDDNPDDVNQLLAAYPGSTFNGKDKVTIPGVGTVDIFKGASVGLNEPQWLAEGGGTRGAATSANAADTVDLGARKQQPDVLDKDTLARLKAELERIINGQPDRQALMSQMGAA